eukprot:CAMPEP_0174266644 /NCGR_PEP_ID=MMETSP0439-20130205/30978_1 /TAXON_ID=0 /ORGANISM="Stereomyxa ramosa, Strain Chinc5" /LENGTH=861 /DNA_ID=CAMNT_0015353739 /DNA_START=25 /DNA_END=2610 /DNA_ORIENTATION=+
MKGFSLLFCSVAVAFLSCFAITPTNGCGISTHIEIAHRALNFFDNDKYTEYRKFMLAHQDAFQAGNPYPDSYYNSMCFQGKYHQVSEDTHWAPFLNSTVNYIRDKYPQPWDTPTQKLVTFLFGFVSHQVADVNWHALSGLSEGFIREMANVNFHGTYSDAHDVADPGGDVVSNFEFDLSYIGEVTEWYVPVEDLVNIYKMYYPDGQYNVTPSIIVDCTSFLFLGRLAERVAIAKLFPGTVAKSPFLLNHFEDYFLGGVTDMAAWTSLVWDQVVTMLENGTDKCSFPENGADNFIKCNQSASPHQPLPSSSSPAPPSRFDIHHPPDFNGLSVDDLNLQFRDRGVYISPRSHVLDFLKESSLAKQRMAAEKSKEKHVEEGSSPTPVAQYATTMPYSRIGGTLASASFSGNNVLLLGAQGKGTIGNIGQGRVYMVPASQTEKNLVLNDTTPSVTFVDGRTPSGKMGTSVTVVDLNKDGIDDVVVSQPSAGAPELLYTGSVLVYFGGKEGIGSEPSFEIKATSVNFNLGWSLASGDLDGDGFKDLVIGSPFASEHNQVQVGTVAVFLSSSRDYSTIKELYVNSSDITLVGGNQSDWFGYSLSVYEAEKLILVSAPNSRKCKNPDCSFSTEDLQAVGKLYAYQVNGTKANLKFMLTGTQQFSSLGTSSMIGFPFDNQRHTPVLAVSIPGINATGTILGIKANYDQAGAVHLIPLSSLMSKTQENKEITINEAQAISIFEGDRKFGRFGWEAKFMDLNSDGYEELVISAPLRTSDITEELFGAEQGSVFVFNGGPSFPKGNVTSNCGSTLPTSPCPGKVANYHLNPSVDNNRFGSSFTSFSNYLFVGAVHNTQTSRLGGSVYVYKDL